MSISKILGGAFILSVVAWSATSAQAQVLVLDRSVRGAVNTQGGNITSEVSTQGGLIVNAINSADSNRTKFETDNTDVFYTDARERLDKMINALSHVDTDTRDSSLYAKIDDQNPARSRVLEVAEGNTTTFGLSLPAGSSGVTEYNKRYRFASPDQLYPSNLAQKNHITDIQKALYYAEATVGETDAARQERYDVYEDLADKAKATADVKAAMEVNNALLIENGRNLALLIQLQTAQLNAESTQMRELMQARQTTAGLFGIRGTGPT